jgi:hypothetical protein
MLQCAQSIPRRAEEHSVEVLFEDPLVVVTGPNNPLSGRRKIAFAELLAEPWTLQPRENSFGAFAMDAFRAAGHAPPRITVATTSSNLRGEMLATGRYLTMVPRYWVLLSRARGPAATVGARSDTHSRPVGRRRCAAEKCLFLARLGPAEMFAIRSLSGGKRSALKHAALPAYSPPGRTSATQGLRERNQAGPLRPGSALPSYR